MSASHEDCLCIHCSKPFTCAGSFHPCKSPTKCRSHYLSHSMDNNGRIPLFFWGSPSGDETDKQGCWEQERDTQIICGTEENFLDEATPKPSPGGWKESLSRVGGNSTHQKGKQPRERGLASCQSDIARRGVSSTGLTTDK